MLFAVAVLIAAVALCVIMVGLFGWEPRAGHGTIGQIVARILMVVGGLLALLLALALLALGHPAQARDLGQWQSSDPDLRAWYEGLMQPDVPTMSCCGEADAYFCDDYRLQGGKGVCTITDDRDDAPRRRPHVDVGTVIEIPPHKLKWDRGNPTGHGVVFLSRNRYVFCYVQAGGA